jgi:hypothetical protein
MTDVDTRVIEALRELIAALDRRIPHLERPTERDIARDAKVLRDKAVQHLKALQDRTSGGTREPPLRG